MSRTIGGLLPMMRLSSRARMGSVGVVGRGFGSESCGGMRPRERSPGCVPPPRVSRRDRPVRPRTSNRASGVPAPTKYRSRQGISRIRPVRGMVDPRCETELPGCDTARDTRPRRSRLEPAGSNRDVKDHSGPGTRPTPSGAVVVVLRSLQAAGAEPPTRTSPEKTRNGDLPRTTPISQRSPSGALPRHRTIP